MSIPESIINLINDVELIMADMIRKIRWKDGVYCPHCKSRNIIKWGRYKLFQRYKCKDCKRTFNDKTGTIFHNSKIPLFLWGCILFLFVLVHTSQRKISILFCTSFKSIFINCKKVMIKISSSLPLPKGIEGEIEIDESYITAGLKGRNNSEKIKELGRRPRKRGLKRRGRGRYQADRPPIIALILRGGYRMVFSAKRATKATIQKIISSLQIREGSTIFTDEYTIYLFLSGIFNHQLVNHSKGEYARGEAHVNSCEGEFSVFKTFIRIHRGVAKYNLPLYVSLYQLHIRVASMNLFDGFRYVMEVILSEEPSHPTNILGK